MNWFNGICVVILFIGFVTFLYDFIKKEKLTDGIWVLILLNMLMYLLKK